MKGSYLECPFCESIEIDSSNEWSRCVNCGHVIEEFASNILPTPVYLEQDHVLTVTNLPEDDVSRYNFDDDTDPDDMYAGSGFVTAFSTMSMTEFGMFSSVARSSSPLLQNLTPPLSLRQILQWRSR
jgi:hypothetical protein